MSTGSYLHGPEVQNRIGHEEVDHVMLCKHGIYFATFAYDVWLMKITVELKINHSTC